MNAFRSNRSATRDNPCLLLQGCNKPEGAQPLTKMEPDPAPVSIPVLIEREDYTGVVTHCEKLQLQAAMHGTSHPLFAPHLFSLLLVDRLPSARFLILQRKAVPSPPPAPEAAAIAVGEALWKRDTPAFFAAVRAHSWDAGMQPLALALERVTRNRVFDLLATGYSCVHVDAIAAKLGAPSAAVRPECIQRGWTPVADEGDDAGFLRPPKKKAGEGRRGQDPLLKMSVLADQLVRLQTSA